MTLYGGMGRLRHRDAQYVNPPGAAGGGLATAALPHQGCCLMMPHSGREQEGPALLHTSELLQLNRKKHHLPFGVYLQDNPKES